MAETGNDLQSRIAALTPEQRRLLELRRQKQEEAAAASRPRPLPRREGAELPLSFAQQRLWFLHRLDPASPAYNLLETLRLAGPLDAAALDLALGEIVARHEALRTRFAESGGRPFQVVEPPRPFAARREDLRGLPAGEREAEALRRAAAAALEPFDLAAGGLLRATLYALDDGHHVLALTVHHIVFDGWSFGLLMAETAALYGAFAAGRPSPLPPLPLQYADYAAWQRSWLAGAVLDEQLAWWKPRLAGAPPLLELPTDRPRPAVQSFRGGRLPFRLEGGLADAVAAFARAQGVTAFMALLAAFDVLLARWSGQSDLVVGTPVANRRHVEVEKLMGLFANTLPLRADLGDDPAFGELARRVRETALGAFAHQDLPFERLVDELRLERHLAYSPLFQVMFNLQNARPPRLELPGLTLAPLDSGLGVSAFDLTLNLLEPAGGALEGWVEYGADLFDRATVERLLGHYGVLLAALLADPALRAAEAPLLTDAERRQLAAGWSDTSRAWDGSTLIHELFAAQAARRPDAVAVSRGGETLTYGELAARARRLARRLRRLGVGPEVRVGLCVERTPEMVVALLGILEAGGAYVPLDPAHPAERLAAILEDGAVGALVTEEGLLERLPAVAAPVLRLDADRGEVEAESAAPLPRLADPESLAYVIYTSGSTGRPKGVQLPHRAVVNFLRAMAERPGMAEDDAVPALTTLTFDISVLEILLPLAVGARVEVIGREEAADGVRLARRLAGSGVTLAQATPATWRMLIDSGWRGLPGLTVLCGGEALPRELAAALHERGARVWNVYGPTETAVWSSVEEVAPGEGPVRLGGPIANIRFHVVDPRLAPVPVGVAGELLIGGAGLARGYLGRPDLTADRFVPDPFAAVPGGRVYRTGDLVRWRPSGELEFLGRIDHQVKVRGFRIELGDVESALLRHPAVREAVVTAPEQGGSRRLVAYVVADGEAGSLREHLRGLLPDYMVPSAFVTLEALPRTPSGKVDRKALPAVPEEAGAGAGSVPPRGPVEELLAGIWAEVLRVERVGAEDDFFDLGGHSLLATQVVSQIRAALGVEVPLQRLFAAPTVAGLARAVEEARRTGGGPALPPLARAPRQESYPLSFSQERMWFLHQLDPGSSAYNLAQAVRLSGDLDVAALEGAFGALVRRHEALRTAFRLEEGRPAQAVAPAAPFRLPTVDLSALSDPARGGESRRLATLHQALPFDLARGPLLRVTLLRLGAREHALLLALHHIVADGWSFGVLVRDLVALYGAAVSGAPAALPELPVQYPDFALWQRRALSGEVLEAEIGYWRRTLAGDPPPLRLPADRRRGEAAGFQAEWEALDLDAALVADLRRLSRRQSASLFMTLLAAWDGLLARATYEDDLLIGAPIANRNRAEVEGLIGFFLNTLLLRTDAGGDPAFSELLGRVRETALGAFAHQDLPLESVLQAASPERDPARSSPFQIMFLLQNLPPQELAAPGLTFSGVEAELEIGDLGTAIFEAGLTLIDREEGGLTASVTYNALLFDRASIARLLARYRRLLAAAAADPGRRLWDLDLLGDAERAELLAWGSAPPQAPFTPVHRAFEALAAAAPDAPAVLTVAAGGGSLTYGELDRRANALAHRLRERGVGPDAVVGIAAERSPALIVALIAVLKAGGAYVPLDPAYPEERLAFMLEDAGVSLLLATSSVLAAAPVLERVPALRLDGEGAAEERRDPPAVEVHPGNLVYLIYTSGSTGRPKGVMVCHGPLAGYVASFRTERGLTPADRVLQFASIGFDTSAEEIYSCLTSGAALVLRDDAMLASTPEFLRACAGQGVSVLDLPTAFWHDTVARLTEEPLELPPALRLMVLAGERILPERLAAWHALGHVRVRLVNTYGPTETTIVATRCELPPGLAVRGEVPIGTPVPGGRAYVADPRLELAPDGIPGELCIGGAILARGYLGRPDLTAERFVPDPWSPEPGARLYRTGDLVRRLPAAGRGDLEFLGRTDDQVKIRGQRVELREVESALGLHPGVDGAVVTAREDTPGDRRLAAYLVPRQAGAAPTVSELRAFLGARLPEFMVPSAFVVLDAFPLTPSGKIDRRALPAPERGRAADLPYVEPRTPAEETVAAVWREVLGVDRVGAADDFFALGGHSLLLPQVLHRLRAAFQVDVPLRLLFDEPTVEGLALAVEEVLLDEIERQLAETEGEESLVG